jgi:hypothetical protein
MPMRRRRVCGACIVVLLAVLGGLGPASASAEDGGGQWPMRWRVYCDPTVGFAFRFPYEDFVPDQYKVDIYARDPEPVALADQAQGRPVPATIHGHRVIHAISALDSALPAALHGAPLAAIGTSLCGKDMQWQPYDFYDRTPGGARHATRPQATPAWAPPGITAMTGSDPRHCALLVHAPGRTICLVLAGRADDDTNRRILASCEVLPGVGRGRTPMTWRQAQGRNGAVIDAEGTPGYSDTQSPVDWTDGWDLETAHFHITTQVSPGKLLYYGAYLEALFRAYSALYDLDAIPPYKFEVEIFNSHQDFLEALASQGFTLPQTVGGLFVPGLLSIFAFQECGDGSRDFTVEHVLAHECSHQFLHMICNGSAHVPTWINEGLAVYFESGVFENGEFQVRPPRERIARLRDIYGQLRRPLIPLDRYLDYYGHIIPEQYGEVYCITAFWLFGQCTPDCPHTNCGLSRFRAYWKALKAHENGTVAFERIFMDDMVRAHGGSRSAAIADWTERYMTFVMSLR